MSETLILSVAEALSRLGGERSAGFVERPTYDIRLYSPKGVDPQTPHARDEAYIIASGSGGFWCEGETKSIGPGDLLFVEAGVEHRFVDFTDDFSAWVFFFGEKPL